MIDDYLTGFSYPFRGLGLIRRRGIRPLVVVPFLLNTVIFAGAIVLAAIYLNTTLEALLPAWLEWLIWPLFVLAVLAVFFFGFTLLANLAGAPFNGLLAARLETQLSGVAPESGLSWAREAGTAIVNELRKLIYISLRALPLLLLFLIPGVQLLAPLVWLAFGAWMLALEYADAPMGNHGLGFRDARRLLAQRPALALGFGSAMLILTLVPVLNFVAMPAGVAGATAMWVERLRSSTAG
ncbi:sulfate transporter CysZ [Thioalkalivibrio thiocyanodenitrificans]|uniref:sulfate transporter CysZ n=1 Tax=Thioalkalivibrio thiocyanodenitrificans TaxID=243063 RepID=UPI0003640D59|nr:sulfate transporter CysZ [Thioalkalivibrio thiocyanodenitrificans]